MPLVRRHLVLAVLAFLAIQVSGCNAKQVSGDWKSDCVGRLELGFPGDVEVSAQTIKSWEERRKNPNLPPYFPDGQAAQWASYDIKVSHALEPKDLDALYRRDVWTKDVFNKEVAAARDFPYDGSSFKELSTSPLQGAGWQYGIRRQEYLYRQSMVVRLGQHLVRFDDSAGGVDDRIGIDRLERDFNRIRQNLVYRPLFTVPIESGVCYPYLFLRDDAIEGWNKSISVTYRLKDHPDITIWLLHGSAPGPLPVKVSRREAAERKADYFWNDNYRDYKSIASVLSPLHVYQPVKFAGREGVESFVEITRRDGTVDWGYLVSAPRDPDAKSQDGDVMFYVIRDAAVARAKGIQPFGQDQDVLKWARTIAATVKPRTVNASTPR